MMNRMVRLILVITLLMTVNSTNVSTLAQSEKVFSSSSGFFTENKGQWDPSILFVGNTSFGKVAFAKDAVYYQMVKSVEKTFETQVVKLSFVNPQFPKVQGDGLLTHYNNYFIGNDPSKWASYCHNYSKIEYLNVWEGIDLAYFFTPQGLKYEYYISPEANIQDLQIRVEGAELDLMGGSLQIATALSSIQDSNLKVFDQTTLRTIPSHFQIQDNIISFTGIPEKRENTIVIDPLVFGSYLGGSEEDQARNIAIDNFENVIISGRTKSTNFPTTPGVIKDSLEYGNAAFVTKFNSTGTELIFSTFLGGKAITQQWDLTLDLDGNIYVCGGSGDDFPTTEGCFQAKHNGHRDGFIAKLDTTGTKLLFSTFIGGSESEDAIGITVDKETNIYVCGQTQSFDFPLTKDAYQKNNNYLDLFISKLNPTGANLLSSTYLGGGAEKYSEDCISDEPSDIVVDIEGNIYVTGKTCCSNFPTTKGVFQENFKKGWFDVFVSKLNNTCSDLLYSSFLGGSDYDQAYSISVDTDGNAYVCGDTTSTNFPITKEAYQSKLQWRNGFVTKINSTGTTLVYSTLLGGSEEDEVHDIILDSFNNAYITGFSKSSDFPISEDAYQMTFKGGWGDAFVTKLDPTGSEVIYSTFVGGSGTDQAFGIDLDVQNNVYICGFTESSNFPTTPKAYRRTLKGDDDVFLVKLDIENKEKFDDITPPIFVITKPKDDSTTENSVVQVKGKVFDKESKIALFQVWGENIPIDDYDGSFEISWDLNYGKNTIELIATNRAKLTTTKILTITRIKPDSTPPFLEIESPDSNKTVSVGQIIVKGKVYDHESGIESLTLNKEPIDVDISDGTFSYLFPLLVGENKIDLIATNGAKLTTIRNLTVTRLSPDKTGPMIIMNAPLPFAIVTESQLLVKGKAIDYESGLQEVLVNKKRVPFNENGEFETVVNLEDFENIIKVEARDKQDNNSVLSMTVKCEPCFKKSNLIIELWTGKTQAYIDGMPYTLDAPPMIVGSRTQVPIRFIAEGLRATVNYDAKSQKIVIQYKTTTITLQIDNPEIVIRDIVNGVETVQKYDLEISPFVYKGRTMVPVRFISEAFGAKVEYESTDRSIVISMKR